MGTDDLIRQRREDGARKRQAVIDAVKEITTAGRRATVAATAETAGVSRQFIYDNPELVKLVRSARPVPSTKPSPKDVEIERLRARVVRAEAKAAEADDKLRRVWGASVEQVPTDELVQRINDLEARNAHLAGQLRDTEAALAESTDALVEVTEQLEAARALNRSILRETNRD